MAVPLVSAALPKLPTVGKRVAIVEREPEPGGAAVHTGTLVST
jgi:hypothetical protein